MCMCVRRACSFIGKGRKPMWKISLISLAAVVVTAAPSLANTTWSCADVETARKAFADSSASLEPNYTEGPAVRVQRQHPDTGMIGQAKFIGGSQGAAGICQYYNHVGWIYTTVRRVAAKSPVEDPDGWRREYTESYPEQDRPGREMMEVCMEEKNGLFWPSVKCGFVEKLLSNSD